MCLVMVLALTACGKSEKTGNSKLDNCLPFGLKFGDSYDDFSKKVKSAAPDETVPQLINANNNNGYVVDSQIYVRSTIIPSYLGYTVGSDSYTLPSFIIGSFAFSFNQNKKLYEWYWFNGDLSRDSEADVEEALNCMLETYNDMFGFDGSTAANEDEGVYAVWNTNEGRATLQIFGEKTLVLVLHSSEYDLNS